MKKNDQKGWRRYAAELTCGWVSVPEMFACASVGTDTQCFDGHAAYLRQLWVVASLCVGVYLCMNVCVCECLAQIRHAVMVELNIYATVMGA